MPISKKDELRVRLSDKRVKAWKEAMLLPPKKRDNCKGIAFASGQEKPESYVYRDKVVESRTIYPDRDPEAMIYAAQGMVSPEKKSFAGFVRRGDNFSDYADTEVMPVKAAPSPFVKPRADSPFKRMKAVPVIIRK